MYSNQYNLLYSECMPPLNTTMPPITTSDTYGTGKFSSQPSRFRYYPYPQPYRMIGPVSGSMSGQGKLGQISQVGQMGQIGLSQIVPQLGSINQANMGQQINHGNMGQTYGQMPVRGSMSAGSNSSGSASSSLGGPGGPGGHGGSGGGPNSPGSHYNVSYVTPQMQQSTLQVQTSPHTPQGPRSSQLLTPTSGVPGSGAGDKQVNFPIHKLSSLVLLPVELYNLLVLLYQSIRIKKYATLAINPTRNYLTVYEFSINDQWIIWDYETGFVHLTGMWKAAEIATSKHHQTGGLHKAKADIVKLLDSTPKQYHEYIKRIRGGFLKIQGTWLPYNLCKILARRFCYYIRYELIPIFGPDFPDICLAPYHRKFGELRFDDKDLEDSKPNFDIFEASKCLLSLSKKQLVPVLPDSMNVLPTSTLPTSKGFGNVNLPSFSNQLSYTVKPESNITFKLNPFSGDRLYSNDNSYLQSTSPKSSILSPANLKSPFHSTHRKTMSMDRDLPGIDVRYDGLHGTNYTTARDGDECKGQKRKLGSDGINSLLAAADLADNPPRDKRISIKINDLLT